MYKRQVLGVFGKGWTPQDIAKRLSTALQGGLTPEQMQKLKEADQSFELQMRELDIDLERVHHEDRDSARRMQVKTRSYTMPVLAFLVILAFIGSLAGVFWLAAGPETLDPTVATLVGAVVGYAAAAMNQLCSFFWGSSEGGDQAAQHLADVAKKGQ